MRVLMIGSMRVTGEQMLLAVTVTVIVLYILQLVFIFRALSKKKLSNEKGLKAPMLVTLLNIAVCSVICKVVSFTRTEDAAQYVHLEWFGVILFAIGAIVVYLVSFLLMCLLRSLRIWAGKRKRARLKRKRERQYEEY